MRKSISHISVGQTSKVVALLYALVSLLFVPLGIIAVLFGGEDFTGAAMLICAPIIYGVLGYIFTALFCWLYNIVAHKTGGIEITLSDRHESIKNLDK